MSLLYNINGKTRKLNIKSTYETNFFRKMLIPSTGSYIELEIAKIIKNNPHPNLVKVYKVSKQDMYIDYQLLDTDYNVKKKDMSSYINHIRKGVKHLHKLNIVYVDFKYDFGDNIGYDKDTDTYRIYDFDASGIVTNSHKIWKKHYEPPMNYNYSNYFDICSKKNQNSKIDSVVLKLCENKKLTKIDDIMFYIHFNELL
jgi:serine/threonine protein kinase